MKKIITLALAIILCLTMSLTAFAATGGFISSPSKNTAPVVVEVKSEQNIVITVTPYAERDKLSSNDKAAIENAYKTIAATDNIETLNSKLKTVAEKKKLKVENLGISDLFDVSANAEITKEITIKLQAETAKYFVALLHYENNAWTLVENASVTNDVLTFSVDGLSPFAIVVDRQKSVSTAPLTADNGVAATIAVMLLVSALGIAVVTKKVKA